MRFGSVCSGIEAASVAWEPLGWEAAWFSEIEPFPCAVLAHHYPSVPNLGDMTTLPSRILGGEVEAPDVFCGGTPCQAFSVAGKRQSLDDARGNLSLVFCEIANAIDDVRRVAGQQPTIVFWENVPGVLSTKDNAFGCFLGELAGEDCAIEPPRGKWTNAGCVYGPKRTVAWRVLDAQYFGVAQRRRRVFVVASARNDFDPAAVLFEFDSLRRDTAPSRETWKVAPTIPSRSTAGGGLGTDFDCDGGLIQTFDRQSTGEYGTQPVASTVAARDYKSASDLVAQPINFGAQMSVPQVDIDLCQTLGAKNPQAVAQPVKKELPLDPYLGGEVTIAIDASYSKGCGGTSAAERPVVADGMAVRLLTPVECERLQGFSPVLEILRIEICIDHQNKNALAEIKCHRLQSNAWTAAESEYLQFVSNVEKISTTGRAYQGKHVAVYARQHYAGSLLALRRSQSESSLYASNAGKQNWSRSPILDESFAAVLAPHWESLAREVTHGRAASHQSIRLSLAEKIGETSAKQSGEESAESVNDAENDASVERFTTSLLGRVIPTCDSKIATSLCSVIRATSSFIQNETHDTNLCIDLVLERDYTQIPWRKKPASECPDGPRYKALGNSWAVPNVRWIGHRIQLAVEIAGGAK